MLPEIILVILKFREKYKIIVWSIYHFKFLFVWLLFFCFFPSLCVQTYSSQGKIAGMYLRQICYGEI